MQTTSTASAIRRMVYASAWLAASIGFAAPLSAASRTTTAGMERRLEQLQHEIADFEAEQRAADEKMLQAFDKLLATVERNRDLSAMERDRVRSVISDARKQFVSGHTLPTSDELLGLSVEYLDYLHGKSLPIRRRFQEAFKFADGDQDLLKQVSTIKAGWEDRVPGAGELTDGSAWHGVRVYSDGGTSDFHLHVGSSKNGIVTGSIWQCVHNTWTKTGCEFEGRFEGNRLLIKTTKSIHGGRQQLNLAGYMIERRLVLRVVSAGGKPVTEFVSVAK